ATIVLGDSEFSGELTRTCSTPDTVVTAAADASPLSAPLSSVSSALSRNTMLRRRAIDGCIVAILTLLDCLQVDSAALQCCIRPTSFKRRHCARPRRDPVGDVRGIPANPADQR